MKAPTECPAGNVYDASVHGECPCPACWAKRASERLTAVKQEPAADDHSSHVMGNQSSNEAAPAQTPVAEPAAAGMSRGKAFKLAGILVFLVGVCVAYVMQMKASSEDDRLFAQASGNIERLGAYLRSCKEPCGHRPDALDEIAGLEKEADQQRKQEEAAFKAARGKIDALRAYAANCKICALKNTANEEITYLSARTNAVALKSYIGSCKICEFGSEARAEISRLELAEQEKTEQQMFDAARADANALRRYVGACRVCAFKSNALDEIHRLDEEAKISRFQVCNNTSYSVALAVSGRRDPNAPDWTIKGWWNLAAGACQPLGNFARGHVYVVATVYGQSLGWRGETNLCVAAEAFSRTYSTGYSCSASEHIERFMDIWIESAAYTWSIEGAPTPLMADFSIANNTASAVNVSFYDGGTREQIDPPQGRVYVHGGNSTQRYRIQCTIGQKVCYSAVMQGTALSSYWGVGYNGKQSCDACCTVCGGSLSTKTLEQNDARQPKPTITWTIVDNTSKQLSVAFYSQNRSFGWPAWNKNWTVLKPQSTFSFECQAGERICYGAWPIGNINGLHWGAGPFKKYGCTSCCAVCDGGTYTMSVGD